MTRRKRRKFPPALKARICIDAIREEKSLSDLATEYEVSVNVIRSWEKPPYVRIVDAHAEAVFRTCKYRPNYPRRGFKDIAAARQWVYEFVRWYNEEHLYSGIGFVTPQASHQGQDNDILNRRKEVYEQARRERPERWSRHTRNWVAPREVWLNKPKDETRQIEVHRERKDSKAA